MCGNILVQIFVIDYTHEIVLCPNIGLVMCGNILVQIFVIDYTHEDTYFYTISYFIRLIVNC